MIKKVSLKDIAEKVGVSIALVSYVLNNKKEGRIGKEISEKIRTTAKKMNYRPNLVAKSLKSNRTKTIGLIVADIANPFSSNIARIIEDEAEKNGYTVIFGSSDEKVERFERLLEVFMDRQVDGFIIAPVAQSEKHIETLQKNKVPFVLIDRYFPDLKVNGIMIDNFKASYDAVMHLIETGCKRIGIVAFKTSLLHLKDRKRGYKAALKKGGILLSNDYIKEVAIDITTGEEVNKAINDLLSLPDKADAILFASNKISTIGLKYLNGLKLKIPEELSVVSFDQSDAAEVFYAPVTHIHQPLQDIGQQAVKRLLESFDNDKQMAQLQLQAKLVIRKSTKVLPDQISRT